MFFRHLGTRSARVVAGGGVVRGAAVWCTALVLSLSIIARGEDAAQHTSTRYLGCSDASACAVLDGGRIAVAGDEDNVIRVYDMRAGGEALETHGLDAHLGTGEEADIEASARVGEVVYWIGSHGRSKKGKWRDARQRFFATRVVRGSDGDELLEVHGAAYAGLLTDMLADELLGAAIRQGVGPVGEQSERHAPKLEGVNIEGLAETGEGTVVIAFRNPGGRQRVDADGFGSALLVELMNPAGVVEDGERARFGAPVWVGLPVQGPYGIRSIARREDGGGYYFVAGLIGGGESESALCAWDGESERAELVRVFENGFNAEALAVLADGSVVVLSDDGGDRVGEGERKDLDRDDPGRRSRGKMLPGEL